MRRSLVVLFLLTLAAYGGVKVFYGHLAGRLQAEMARTGSGSAAGVAQVTDVGAGEEVKTGKPARARDYQVIVRRNIFQAQLDAKEVEKEEKPEDLAETSLKLALVGTVTGSDRDARAIIVDEKKKRQDIYQIGDVVQGALIKKVERGRVVLEVNGRDEVLLIKERKGGAGGEAGISSRTPPAPWAAPTTPETRKSVPKVKPHRRITFRTERTREVLEPADPLSAGEMPPAEEETAEPAEFGSPVPGGLHISGEDEAVQ